MPRRNPEIKPDSELSIHKNCWHVRRIEPKVLPNSSRGYRTWVDAKCRKCGFEVSERLDHFVARTYCPECEEKPNGNS